MPSFKKKEERRTKFDVADFVTRFTSNLDKQFTFGITNGHKNVNTIFLDDCLLRSSLIATCVVQFNRNVHYPVLNLFCDMRNNLNLVTYTISVVFNLQYT